MNKNLNLAIIAVVVLSVSVVLTIFLTVKPGDVVVEDPTFLVQPRAVNRTETFQNGNTSHPGTTKSIPSPGLVRGYDETVQINPDYELSQKLDLADEDLLETETVNRLLLVFGSYEELYKAIGTLQREDLIDYLVREEQLRDEVAHLLPVEKDTETRAFMLRRVLPEGLFDSSTGDDEPIDRELMALLDQPTDSAIGPEEWLARMDLAEILDPKYALDWTRDAQKAHPGNPDVGIHAASMTMTIGMSVDDVSKEEREQAESRIINYLSNSTPDQFNASQRKRAYMALYWSDDKEGTRDFFQTRLESESDYDVRRILENLIARLDRKLADNKN